MYSFRTGRGENVFMVIASILDKIVAVSYVAGQRKVCCFVGSFWWGFRSVQIAKSTRSTHCRILHPKRIVRGQISKVGVKWCFERRNSDRRIRVPIVPLLLTKSNSMKGIWARETSSMLWLPPVGCQRFVIILALRVTTQISSNVWEIPCSWNE